MRTIKFRARRKNGEWVVGNFIHHFATCFKNKERYSIFLPKPKNDNDGYWVEDIEPETIGQFSGITDEEGRSVFEGDILEAVYKYDTLTYNGTVDPDNDCICYGVVEFCNDTLQWILNVYKAERYIREYLKEQDCSHVSLCIFGHVYGYDNPNVKVIGNIYDNPELLKGGLE